METSTKKEADSSVLALKICHIFIHIYMNVYLKHFQFKSSFSLEKKSFNMQQGFKIEKELKHPENSILFLTPKLMRKSIFMIIILHQI